MKVFENPSPEIWPQLILRAQAFEGEISAKVSEILQRVKREGDEALFDLTEKLDGVKLTKLFLGNEEIEEYAKGVSEEVKEAIGTAISNIGKFHLAQRTSSIEVETMPGVKCSIRNLPIEKAGLYIPGGSAPLFSTVLMLGVPAKLAGCSDIILFTPPLKGGGIPAPVAYAALTLGITSIVTVGGAQAIAAMAYGTASIRKRDKIFGPGNRYVTIAKELVSREVAIDMPAGPSELMVIADSSCNPAFVAADLLSQAEHGADSQVFLLSDSRDVIENVTKITATLMERLPRKSQAEGAMENSRAILFDNLNQAFEFSNLYAPEHLIISTREPWQKASLVKAAGSVFIGNYSPESAGDYASGTNHTLPTGGRARSCSGITLDSFMHKITFQELTAKGLQSLSETICTMAREESLFAHEYAVKVRI
ncbi:MAG: histidinol dehydrogenase [Rikenellaceae bacterium]|nr:histidinol dehydrogenase [Rikenellaceae bacterium]